MKSFAWVQLLVFFLRQISYWNLSTEIIICNFIHNTDLKHFLQALYTNKKMKTSELTKNKENCTRTTMWTHHEWKCKIYISLSICISRTRRFVEERPICFSITMTIKCTAPQSTSFGLKDWAKQLFWVFFAFVLLDWLFSPNIISLQNPYYLWIRRITLV